MLSIISEVFLTIYRQLLVDELASWQNSKVGLVVPEIVLVPSISYALKSRKCLYSINREEIEKEGKQGYHRKFAVSPVHKILGSLGWTKNI